MYSVRESHHMKIKKQITERKFIKAYYLEAYY